MKDKFLSFAKHLTQVWQIYLNSKLSKAKSVQENVVRILPGAVCVKLYGRLQRITRNIY